jgi:hypothetical protein
VARYEVGVFAQQEYRSSLSSSSKNNDLSGLDFLDKEFNAIQGCKLTLPQAAKARDLSQHDLSVRTFKNLDSAHRRLFY